MRLDRLLGFHIVEMAKCLQDRNVLGSLSRLAGTANEVMRVAGIKVIGGLNLRNVFRSKLETECFDVGLQVLDLAASEKGEQIRSLDRNRQLFLSLNQQGRAATYLLHRVRN